MVTRATIILVLGCFASGFGCGGVDQGLIEDIDGKAEYHDGPAVSVTLFEEDEGDIQELQEINYEDDLCMYTAERFKGNNDRNLRSDDWIYLNFIINDQTFIVWKNQDYCVFNGLVTCKKVHLSWDGKSMECYQGDETVSFNFNGVPLDSEIEICKELPDTQRESYYYPNDGSRSVDYNGTLKITRDWFPGYLKGHKFAVKKFTNTDDPSLGMTSDHCKLKWEDEPVPYDWWVEEFEVFDDTCEEVLVSEDGISCDGDLAVGVMYKGGDLERCFEEPCGPYPEENEEKN